MEGIEADRRGFVILQGKEVGERSPLHQGLGVKEHVAAHPGGVLVQRGQDAALTEGEDYGLQYLRVELHRPQAQGVGDQSQPPFVQQGFVQFMQEALP